MNAPDTDTTFNGWANWVTWNLILWLDNDEWLYRECRRHCFLNLADTVWFIRALLPNGTPDFDSAADFDDVDWDEVYAHFTEDEAEGDE